MNSNEEPNRRRFCGRRRFLKIPFIIAAVVLIKSALVMVLWNEIAPDLFHGPILTYLQAIELTVLAKLLVGFGGFRGGFGPGRGFGGEWHLRERWAKLSPEEREKMREELHKRCGH